MHFKTILSALIFILPSALAAQRGAYFGEFGDAMSDTEFALNMSFDNSNAHSYATKHAPQTPSAPDYSEFEEEAYFANASAPRGDENGNFLGDKANFSKKVQENLFLKGAVTAIGATLIIGLLVKSICAIAAQG